MIEFLTPVSKQIVAHREILPEGVLGKSITMYQEGNAFPDLQGVTFALIGVAEQRNDIDYMGSNLSFDAVRKGLYQLYPGNWTSKVADLGDIRPGAEVTDTYFALKTVLAQLIEQKVIPIVLGGSQDLAYAQYRSYDNLGRMVNLVNVDQRFDLGDAEKPISNKSYVGKIIVDQPYNLFNYSVLGYQSYLNPPAEIALMDKLYFDACRLGQVIGDITTVEPMIRDADLVTLDVTAIKSAELSYQYKDSPNGFDSREICAISRYAGISNKVSSFGIYELKDFEEASNAASLIAQVLWYFMEGVNFRFDEGDLDDERMYTLYKVPINDEILLFRKSNRSGRWWIELPIISSVNNKLKTQTLLPCTYGEYLSATNQEIPERWYKARQKLEV